MSPLKPVKYTFRKTYEAILRIRPGQKDLIVSGFSETDEVREAQRMGAGGLLKNLTPLRNWAMR